MCIYVRVKKKEKGKKRVKKNAFPIIRQVREEGKAGRKPHW